MSTGLPISVHSLAKGSKMLYWIGGSAMIVVACISVLTEMSVSELVEVANRHFGKTFMVLYFGLLSGGMYALLKIFEGHIESAYWYEVGSQCANGISTLALTFTLFGISMGIGALSEQSLTPDNVEYVIAELTAQFSMAFMTTVLGLPTAALLRALICIRSAKRNKD